MIAQLTLDRALLHVEETKEQLEDRRLAPAARADQSYMLSWRYREADVCKRILGLLRLFFFLLRFQQSCRELVVREGDCSSLSAGCAYY